MASVLRLENISKTYGRVRALENVSLGIERNSTVCIAGPNGSGKTTLLSIMAGSIEPNGGSVKTSGSIGYCYQAPRALRDLTVRENVEVFMELYDARKEWIDEVTEITNMGEFLDFKVEDLSYGMQKRMELCISLLPNSDIIVFDEPTTGLDNRTVKEILDLIRKLKGRRTMVIATHQLTDLDGLCDYLVVLKNGRIVFQNNVKNAGDLTRIYLKHLELG